MKEKFTDNRGHIILRLFNIFANFSFAKSETERDF